MAPYFLETDRLRLRRFRESDDAFLNELFGDPEMIKFYPSVRSPAETREWIAFVAENFERHGHGKWMVELKDQTVIGQAGLILTEVEGIHEAEVGYFLHKAHWGFGYATEVAAALARAAHDRFGYQRVISAINPANVPSVNVAKRIGMTRRKTAVSTAGRYSWTADIYEMNVGPSQLEKT